jgi:peptidoglycan/LPS O-acetylase OafA/YrhL
LAERPESYRPDIEGLRAIAVLLVVAYHVRLPGVSAGFMGVDVFFVLSGYLITGLLTQEIWRTGTISITGFYARRMRRLLPGATLMLVATLAASTLMLAPMALVSITRTAIATSLYLSNAWFMSRESDYFAAGSADDPFLHTWSLAVEEQFYLVWPLLLLVAMRLLRSRRNLALLLAVVSVVSFLGCLRLTHTHQPWAFYASPARAWEFATGGLACLIPAAKVIAWPRNTRIALGWTGFVIMVGAAALASPFMQFPGTLALLPVLGTTAVLIAGSVVGGEGVSGVLAIRPLQWLGRLSYSWYLWHWPVLVLASAVRVDLSTPERAGCAVAALVIAAAAYYFVENPVRFNRGLMQQPALTIAMGVSLTVISATISYATYKHALDVSRTPAQRVFAKAARDRAAVYANRCLASWGDARVRECVLGDTAAASTIVLFGDSHAAHWFPALEAVALERHWRIVTMLKVSCPTADVPVFNPNLRRDEHECATWRASALKRIVALRPDRVLLANSLTYVAGPRKLEAYEHVAPVVWGNGVRRTLSVLDSAKIQSFLLRDTPYMTRVIPICLSRHASGAWPREANCDTPRTVAVDDETFRVEQKAAEGLSRAHVIDLTDQFCSASQCEAIRDGMIVYFDAAHITATFSRSIAAKLGAALQ